ncbi:MAG: TlpA family protein disulfide reductase [Bacteroidales bacterium]|nr:TlpA family protein disulfide reductase [Bacteroidales bacterium]
MRNINIVFSILLFVVCTSCNSKKSVDDPDQGYELPPEIEQVPFGTTLGLRAPEIELPDVNGETKRLSDLRGKVVLLDFWASWCNPCRRENPHLVDVYDAYNDKTFTAGNGFEIVSVSLDRNETAWREAIRNDKMQWSYQLGDMEGARTQPALDYKIQMIPINFLLDRNGVIIATNLRGGALEEKLESLSDK